MSPSDMYDPAPGETARHRAIQSLVSVSLACAICAPVALAGHVAARMKKPVVLRQAGLTLLFWLTVGLGAARMLYPMRMPPPSMAWRTAARVCGSLAGRKFSLG